MLKLPPGVGWDKVIHALAGAAMHCCPALADAVSPIIRKWLRTFGFILGVLFFIGLVLSTYEPAYDAWRIGEYEGEGALRVPTWPVRGLVLLLSIFGAFAYIAMIYYDWKGRLIDEIQAPGSA